MQITYNQVGKVFILTIVLKINREQLLYKLFHLFCNRTNQIALCILVLARQIWVLHPTANHIKKTTAKITTNICKGMYKESVKGQSLEISYLCPYQPSKYAILDDKVEPTACVYFCRSDTRTSIYFCGIDVRACKCFKNTKCKVKMNFKDF